MAYTQAHLDALEEAKASGVLTVSFEGRTTTFRSIDEIDRVIADIKKQLNPAKYRRKIYRLSSAKDF